MSRNEDVWCRMKIKFAVVLGSLTEMKTWVDGMRASGGGDGPESVACALHEASTLSIKRRNRSLKIFFFEPMRT